MRGFPSLAASEASDEADVVIQQPASIPGFDIAGGKPGIAALCRRSRLEAVNRDEQAEGGVRDGG
jgi:hypothetical protein